MTHPILLLPAALASLACAQPAVFDPPIVSRGHTEQWSLRFRVDAFAVTRIDPLFTRPRTFPAPQERATVSVETAELFFPVIGRTAASEPLHDPDALETTLRWNAQDRPDDYRLLAGPITKDDRYAQFSMTDLHGDLLTLEVTVAAECWETRFDEQRAMSIAWPSEWPEDAASALEPQPYVDPNAPEVVALVREWTGGATRAVPPAMLAKMIAAKVIDHVQLRGSQVALSSHGKVSAMKVAGAAETAASGAGSSDDLVALYVACCRAAGLPTRLVVGVDVRKTLDTAREQFHSWAEFFLYDEPSGAGEWVPVDIARQKAFSSRAPALDRPWPYFGASDQLDVSMPLAFHFTPPTHCVIYRGPSVWGWSPLPDIPVMDQDLTMTITTPPRRGR